MNVSPHSSPTSAELPVPPRGCFTHHVTLTTRQLGIAANVRLPKWPISLSRLVNGRHVQLDSVPTVSVKPDVPFPHRTDFISRFHLPRPKLEPDQLFVLFGFRSDSRSETERDLVFFLSRSRLVSRYHRFPRVRALRVHCRCSVTVGA